ncbi:TraR/DksA C4-type zinc finger protein [Roseococcus sp. SDR]|uniref:TraR/DksA C4-type zinc finger protein n=1 Tax=Roseococcus sp. SDR TaxID=2835532 RepID=UPI001BCC366D|nr:TraR/DksA C4-type zinc finger protein [Roseococcus sp. SDR]MBS7789247.1 TraR/DksA C4-type zinc finger protein [Roseococcus sp. SDR]MBV1844561.1 TraR/DksA C4-type zinc finger protein [Roseococcus sp. SDR]
MPDEMDRAVERRDAHHAQSIAAVTSRLSQPGALICVDCEEPIPKARHTAMPSAIRCAPCQEAMEKSRVR